MPKTALTVENTARPVLKMFLSEIPNLMNGERNEILKYRSFIPSKIAKYEHLKIWSPKRNTSLRLSDLDKFFIYSS